jgi:hypothetical protein
MKVTIKPTHAASRPCPCGCGKLFAVASGVARSDDDSEILFHVARFLHDGQDHVWIAVGTGPWKPGGPETCWISVTVWRAEPEIATRITEGAEAPWTESDLLGGQWLTRQDVLDQPGATGWLFRWTDALIGQHPALVGALAPPV